MTWSNAEVNCDQARAAIVDTIVGCGVTADASLIEAHIADCNECRAYRAECSAIWHQLADLSTPSPAPGAKARFDAALSSADRSGGGLGGTAPTRRRLLVALGFVLAAALGYGASSWRGHAAGSAEAMAITSVAPADSFPRFLLLLYDTRASSHVSYEEMARTVAEYAAWARALRRTGQLIGGEKLKDDSVRWFGGSVATSAGERIGGYFVIRAHDLTEAQRIAEGCPHLKHGGRIELRAIERT